MNSVFTPLTVEQLLAALPGLTHEKAVERYNHGVAVRNKMRAEGRCIHCGTKGHGFKECELRIAGESELRSEMRRKGLL